uniref:Uncharacterized protein n=1 Tax=Arundo donax TaxID=35708 RepID=A0A0A9HGS3_ARUDO
MKSYSPAALLDKLQSKHFEQYHLQLLCSCANCIFVYYTDARLVRMHSVPNYRWSSRMLRSFFLFC